LVNGEWIRLVHRSAAGEPWRYWATSGAPVKTEVRERTA
jgi:hypothetical protein